ncbi:MAG: carboxy terminal-processing peptidase [Nonlabens ulvanivorans]|uniref:Tail-specific protease n=3 Tax=Nonlabens ulvanivorans TaxID=906888 RepID=A0A090QUP9_NONUL|nr:tail-specific protease precursor [Nonlabens ulvanivorans]
MKGLMNFIKNNVAIAILVLLAATASCSFTKDIDPGDKDKEELLVNLISHVLQRNHYSPADLTDEFSQKVFKNYINDLDPAKRYFLESDYQEFANYEFLLDDEIRDSRVQLFTLTYERLEQRRKEAEKLFSQVIKEPFDFNKDEVMDTDYENIPYAKDSKELKNHWRKLLKLSALGSYYDKMEEQEDKPENERKTAIAIEKEVRDEVKRSMEENFDFSKDIERLDYFSLYLNSVMAYFDPHTSYFAPQNKDRFDTAMSGKLEGIGARLQKKMDYIKVLEIISGGPAWRSQDVEVGDVILKVAQEKDTVATSIVGMRISDAVDLIKGPKGTKVILTLKRVDGTIEDVTLTRDVVEIEETFAKSVIVKDPEGSINYGLINLPKFYFDMENRNGRASGDDIKKEIERLKMQGMDGLVLDLRNNGGGSLREVIEMAGLFIEKGPVVQVALKNERTQTYSDDDPSIIWDGPLVIMVNELSASASEILAAALQDYERAVIIGSKQTFGKGTVQNFEDLNRWVRNSDLGDLGAIKLTTQKFYRINGKSTQLEGVKSDIITPDRYSYIDIGERDEEFPLPYDEIPAASYTKFNKYIDFNSTIAKSQARINSNETFQLIDENAKWMSDQREENIIPLNYTAYKERLHRLEKETEKFEKLEDYKNDLSFEYVNYEKELIAKDSLLAEKRERWHKSLSQDVYLAEAINVLKDLKVSNIQNARVSTIKN